MTEIKKKDDSSEEAERRELLPYTFRSIQKDFDRMIDRFQHEFDETWRRGSSMMPFREFMFPSVDLEDRGKDFCLSVDMPGFEKKDIDIEVTDDAITIHAEKKLSEEEKKKNYIRRERATKSYYRRMELPEKIVSDNAKANLTNGLLQVILPKKEPTEKKKVVIE